MEQLKYIDHKSYTYFGLKHYPTGVSPVKGDIIKVTEIEKVSLLKEKNGHLDRFEEIRKSRKPREEEELVTSSPDIPSED